MSRTRRWLLVALLLLLAALASGLLWFRSGFSAADRPSSLETAIARRLRNFSIPSREHSQPNPWKAAADNIEQGRNAFLARCAVCHGFDGSGQTPVGRGLYPKPSDLRSYPTQELTDGEIHYIIRNGVRLTGMPALSAAHTESEDESWKLVLFIRELQQPSLTQLKSQIQAAPTAHYVGSAACAKCHAEIYDRWKETPMANVVRDPREHPEAIIPDLATNKVAPFTRDQVAFVYGSLWKQRYFTKRGDDYFPLGAQWDVTHRQWRPYFVANGTDWWVSFYPADNMQRPTGPTCDGCHSVNYDIHTRSVTEWNVGCEACHGPGSDHVAHATRENILNPAHMDPVRANDTCIRCHSQGRPRQSPIEGRYYDWPVGFEAGLNLADFWQLEDHTLGATTFTNFADGSAHKNRMQGNDFAQSLMYNRGVTCFNCHDVHGTNQYAQLRKPVNEVCLDCHGPRSAYGPHTATLEEHTHHKKGSAGSACVACHMPKIATTIADVTVRSHTFRFLTPAMTDKYKIPNPCTSCHADKSTAWATDAMRHWPEFSPWHNE